MALGSPVESAGLLEGVPDVGGGKEFVKVGVDATAILSFSSANPVINDTERNYILQSMYKNNVLTKQ